MSDLFDLKARQKILENREWDLPAIEARFNRLVGNDIPPKTLDPETICGQKAVLLDRVQLRSEEYCYLTRNCAKGSATALLEEFGLGNMEIIKALGPFPGLGMSGGICGPVSGGLIALGLYFSDENLIKHGDPVPYLMAQKYIRRFEAAMGSLNCPDIQKTLLGKYFDPMSGADNQKEFNAVQAREKCPLAPGIGARLAAEIIVESMAA